LTIHSPREVDVKKMKMCVLTGIVLCLWAAMAFGADPAPMGPWVPMGPGMMQGRMAEGVHGGLARHLNLSREQQDKLSALTNRYFGETRNLR
jgi:Spy/CpxP family protein refolding chaperone